MLSREVDDEILHHDVPTGGVLNMQFPIQGALHATRCFLEDQMSDFLSRVSFTIINFKINPFTKKRIMDDIVTHQRMLGIHVNVMTPKGKV